MNQQLIGALEGCLNHNTVHSSEQKLAQLAQRPDFTQQLLRLIPTVQQHELLVLLLTTLKNFFTAQYSQGISQEQKQLFRHSAIDLFYQIKHNSNAIKIYKEIVYLVVMSDFSIWPSLPEQILNDLGSRIEAGVYFSRQVAKVHQYVTENHREGFEKFVIMIFPKLEVVVEQIMSNFSEVTSPLLHEIFKTFYSTFHVAPPQYLRDFSAFERWMLFFSYIFQAPTSPLTEKSQGMVAHIYETTFGKYCHDNQDIKQFRGWGLEFRNRYACKLYESVYQLVVNKFGGNQEIYSTLINCLSTVIGSVQLRKMVTSEHIENLFYRGTLLPLCESTKDELHMFQNDGIEYVRRQEDLSCFVVRKAVMGLIETASNSLVFNGKSELMRMVEYCAGVLSNRDGNDGEKEVAVRILSAIGKVLLNQKYFKKQFENLVVTYFQPLLISPNKLLNSLTLSLLSEYLPFGDLSSQAVGSLMELIYAKIIESGSDNLLVVRYNAILAFTSLLGHKAALESAKPHFQVILETYVKTLNQFDHQNLLECLESIVKHFDSEIVNFAPDLLNHLLKMFCSLAKTENEEDDDEDQPDCNTPASAALSTVKQILTCNLPYQLYVNVSVDLLELFRGIFGQYSNYFDEVLSLFAVLCHRAKAIADFEYPYAVCRWLLQGNQLNLSGSKLSNELLSEISKIVKADSEFQDSIIAILKNIIQKAPDHVLRSYPWPKHQQLILALIQNKRISVEELGSLDTSEVSPLWSAYLSAYSLVVYNVGSLANPRDLHEIVGVSLYPWLKEGVSPEMVKIIAGSVDEDQEEDLLEENTAQMLEKYAQEDDEDEEDYNQQTTGTNYTHFYDSPFDVAKDREMLIMQVRSLSNEAAMALVNSLSPRYRQKLEILMNSQNQ